MTTAELVRSTPEADTPRVEPPTRSGAGPVSQLHRALSLITVISLFLGTVSTFDTLVWAHPSAGITIMAAYGCALLLAVGALVVRGRRAMLGVDIGIFLTALLIRLPAFVNSFHGNGFRYSNDEGALIDFGGGLLGTGVNPYTMIWPGASSPHQPGITLTMGGGVVDRYDYPPIPAIWASIVHAISPAAPLAAIAATLSLLAAAIIMFVLLPAPWKSGSTLLFFGLGAYLMPFARQGYPEIMAMPFLILAVNRWSRIGVNGRLGALGITSAIGLGMAISTQQMAWFLTPFLIVGILMCRLGDQTRSAAWRLVTKYVLIVVAVVAAINGPFIVWNPSAWFDALRTPITVATVPHGQGLIDVAYYLLGRSGDLQAFSYASAALAIGLLVCFALFIRRLGPAMAVLPWTVFFLSVRSSDKYFYIMMPLWLLCLASVPARDFVTAHRPFAGWRVVNSRVGRTLITVTALLPAAALSVVAIATPQPLQMTVTAVTPSPTGLTNRISLDVTNTSGQTITPHFALSNSETMSRFWLVATGPATLAPGQSAAYVITPATPGSRRNPAIARTVVRAVSQHPETLSSVTLSSTS